MTMRIGGQYPVVRRAMGNRLKSSQRTYVRANTEAGLLGSRTDSMALPEPTPPLKGKAAIAFLERLEKRKLSAQQKELYRGAREAYERHRAARVG